MDQGAQRIGWTRERVETRLIAAFRAMPACPVYGHGRRVKTASDQQSTLTDVLNWNQLLDRDPNGRKYLWAWARCRATKDSFGALCLAMGWKRSTAEDGRRRGALALAKALQSIANNQLDNHKEATGFSRDIAAAPAPVDA